MRTFEEKSNLIGRVRPPRLSRAANRSTEQSDRASYILHLQRTAGNQAVQRLLAGNPEGATTDSRITAGYMPGDVSDDMVLGGDQDAVNDAGPSPDTQVPATVSGGVASSITTTNQVGPTWGNSGQFKWWINWTTNGTSGWLVQKIENTYSGTKADGTPITNASMGAVPSYYEAWAVAADGTITPANVDQWNHPAVSGGLGSPLSLSKTGTAFWTTTDPAASGFRPGGVSNAGILPSSTTAPAGLSAPLLTRTAHGMWAADGSNIFPGSFISWS